ncbi:hypothetical protein BDV28DRAFT_147406 [Aspergillus coremiiformis]|uniref:Uncharacterized protein n=1 Tax=Aspergillus coremiiformis TaxID=138285 RepID=A0A5N6Z919_9EURO|nr:hypothetical protein BDV28DRAFT_147406 [Aspergillus coremiiformis]
MFAGSVDTLQSTVQSANLAAGLNDRLRRPMPARVYRVNTHRRRYRPPRRRHGRRPDERDHERNHIGSHQVRARPAPANREQPDHEDCHHHRNLHNPRRVTPPASDKEDIQRSRPADPAHSQLNVAYDRLNSSVATPRPFAGSSFAIGTKLESETGNLNDHLVGSASSDIVATSTRSGLSSTSFENIPSLTFNTSGDMVMTEEPGVVVDEYCSELFTIV